jgi:hypothetical protein
MPQTARETDSALSTRELLELAIHWGITTSAVEFWKRHKSRDELVKLLQRKKESIEMQAKLQEAAPVMAAAAAAAAEAQERKVAASRVTPARRRRSLVSLGELFPGKDVVGDLFGTKGACLGGWRQPQPPPPPPSLLNPLPRAPQASTRRALFTWRGGCPWTPSRPWPPRNA